MVKRGKAKVKIPKKPVQEVVEDSDQDEEIDEEMDESPDEEMDESPDEEEMDESPDENVDTTKITNGTRPFTNGNSIITEELEWFGCNHCSLFMKGKDKLRNHIDSKHPDKTGSSKERPKILTAKLQVTLPQMEVSDDKEVITVYVPK